MRFTGLRTPRACVVLACLVVLGACSEAGGTATDPDADADPARRSIPVSRVELVTETGDPLPQQMLVGSSVRFYARTYDATNESLSGRKALWSMGTATTIATVNNTGTVSAQGPGNGQLIAAVEGIVATHSFAVVTQFSASPAPAPTPVVTAPTSPTSIAANVVRFDGATGTTLVSTGVPLVKGVLRAGQEAYLHVTVNGIEQPIYAAGLPSTHGDGSLRAVRVQFNASVGATPLPARVEVTSTARTSAMTIGAQLASAPAVPTAALLPTEPAYLIATDIVGQTIPKSATTAMGGAWAKYDADFAQYADYHWTTYGDSWEHDYYDRALAYYAQWVRTGNPTYWYRGTRHALAYRRDYLEVNNYGASPHWSQLEGLEKHYLLTGDEASRTAVARTADIIWGAAMNMGGIGTANDPRITGRIMLGSLLAWRLGGAPGVSVDFAARLDDGITKIAAWQSTSGAYDSGSLFCGGQFNFMVGLLNDALVKVHTYYKADARIVTMVKKSVDYMWTTQWIPTASAFKYSSVACSTGGPDPAADLTGLIVAPYGWVYKQTGDANYRTIGEQLFQATVTGGAPFGPKQFNQEFTSSWRYLGYR